MSLAALIRRAMPGLCLSESEPDTALYAHDLWPRHLIELRAGRVAAPLPLAVVWPASIEEVARLVELANQERFQLLPFGAGSGVCGGIAPAARSVIVDTKRLDELRLDDAGPTAWVGAGVLGIDLERELERSGYTSGHFPSSIVCSTVGGWAATRSAGQCSGRYGKIEDMTVGLECVLGSGRTLTLARHVHARDLLPLLIGSEGTLGIITRVGLRLHPSPELRLFRAFAFPDLGAGMNALRAIYQTGLRPAVARLYDAVDSALSRRGSAGPSGPRRGSSRDETLGKAALSRALRFPRLLNRAVRLLEKGPLASCALVIVVEGPEEEAREQTLAIERLCANSSARSLGEGPARHWFEHRYSVSFRQSEVFRMGAFNDTFEVAAPWSLLAGVHRAVRDALAEHALVLSHVSHSYPDGASIYFTFVGTARDDRELERYDAAWRDALGAAVAAGATLSHHHGVGRSKAAALAVELGRGGRLLSELRRAWDTEGVLNPDVLGLGTLGSSPGAQSFGSNETSRRSSAPVAQRGAETPGIDPESQLATFSGETTLGAANDALAAHRLTLRCDVEASQHQTLDAWIAAGLPGTPDPWNDPVDHVLAGFEANLGGERLCVRPSPRRAVGPDFGALLVGNGARFGVVARATLRVRPRGAAEAPTLPYAAPRNPEENESERRAWRDLGNVLAAGRQA
jgi:alkyldihydroxyacetonephosphate synthase